MIKKRAVTKFDSKVLLTSRLRRDHPGIPRSPANVERLHLHVVRRARVEVIQQVTPLVRPENVHLPIVSRGRRGTKVDEEALDGHVGLRVVPVDPERRGAVRLGVDYLRGTDRAVVRRVRFEEELARRLADAVVVVGVGGEDAELVALAVLEVRNGVRPKTKSNS